MTDLLDELSLINDKLSEHIKENFNIPYPQGIICLGLWIDLKKPFFEEILNNVFIKNTVDIFIDENYSKKFQNPTLFDIFLFFNEYLEKTESHAVFLENIEKIEENKYFLFAGS